MSLGLGRASLRRKNHFCLVSHQKAKEDEFIYRQQGKISVLKYASKFMELSCSSPDYVADEKWKMNQFEAEFNLGLKEQMSVGHYTS